MISKDDLKSLTDRLPTPESPVLSVYLDTDQSRDINVQRAFEIILKDMLRDVKQQVDEDKRKEYQGDAQVVRQFIESYHGTARGLIIFCDDSENFFRVMELNVRVRNGAWWDAAPYVRPLVELLDEYERYAVVLADRAHARLFSIFLGEIEERKEVLAEADVTHIKAPGTDHLRSQMNVERKADEHAHWHLKRVAELMSRLADTHEFDRLILAGPPEATGELEGLLPARLRPRLVRQIPLPVDASEATVLEETLKVEEQVEREREARLVEDLNVAAHKHEKAVLGVGATMRAIQEWRVLRLVYSDGFARPGVQCGTCGALFAEVKNSCDFCGQAVHEVSDVVERADALVLAMRGKVDQVRAAAATRLQELGNIGAFLRF